MLSVGPDPPAPAQQRLHWCSCSVPELGESGTKYTSPQAPALPRNAVVPVYPVTPWLEQPQEVWASSP